MSMTPLSVTPRCPMTPRRLSLWCDVHSGDFHPCGGMHLDRVSNSLKVERIAQIAYDKRAPLSDSLFCTAKKNNEVNIIVLIVLYNKNKK